ncbi:hypothetical protein QOT17_007686 [Balamuthia mandrillaris]
MVNLKAKASGWLGWVAFVLLLFVVTFYRFSDERHAPVQKATVVISNVLGDKAFQGQEREFEGYRQHMHNNNNKEQQQSQENGTQERRERKNGKECHPDKEAEWSDACLIAEAERMIEECEASRLSDYPTAIRDVESLARNASADAAIYYLHIEKSGGSNMWDFFRENEAGRSINTRFPEQLGGFQLGFKDKHYLNKKQIETARSLFLPSKVIIGHFVYGIHELTPERPYMYITMFREPLDRLVSQYHFWQQVYGKRHGIDFHDFLTNTSKPAAPHKDNLMTKVLCSTKTYRTPRGNLTYHDLLCSMRNLRDFSVVLMTEQYELSLLILRKTFGWTKGQYLAKEPRNATGKHQRERDKQPPEIIAAAEPILRYDDYLYRFAQCLWRMQRERFAGLIPEGQPLNDETLYDALSKAAKKGQ